MAKSWKKAEGATSDTWKPTVPGEQFIGELLEVRTVNTSFGEKQIADFLCDGNRKAQVWLSPTTLNSKWEKLMPQSGEEIRITYLGKVKNLSGTQEYNNYELEVMRDDDYAPPATRPDEEPPPCTDENIPF